MTVNEAFAKNVKAALIDREWTQAELADRAGIHKSTINGLLLLRYGTSLYTAYAIAKVLEEPLDKLIEGADE